MYEKIKSKVEEIHEGIQNLKNRTDFDILEHKERLWEIEIGIDKYREHNEIDGLKHALQVFREAATLSKEGAATYNETIWNANVQVKSEMVILDELFSKLEDLIQELN